MSEEREALLGQEGVSTQEEAGRYEPFLGQGGRRTPGQHYNSFPRSPSVSVSELPKPEEIVVYKRRWYIIVLFGLFALTQNCVWNTWGPISTTACEAFDWDNSTIAWMANWGPIAYLLSGLVYPWLLQVKGLRLAVVSSVVQIAIGTTLRVITSDPETATILIHAGQFFNGMAGPMAMGAITQVSTEWFPPHERVAATALGSSIGVFGVAISFVLGPYLVTGGPPDNATVPISTQSPIMSTTEFNMSFPGMFESENATTARIHRERKDIMTYMYYSCAWSWFVTFLIIIYFPSKPPKPPSSSATTERDQYWAGLWSLRKKGSFLAVSMIYGVSLGVLGCWSSVLNTNLSSVNVSETTVGWIGFYATIAACIVGTGVGCFSSFFVRQMKLFILTLYVLGTGCFVLFLLVLKGIVPFHIALIYITVIGGNAFLNGAIPLMFELAAELAYPTGEAAANGILTYINNIGGFIFLAVFLIPNIGTMWMNWFLIVSTFLCVPLIGVLKTQFNRLEIDEGVQKCVEQEVTVPESKEQDVEVRGTGPPPPYSINDA